MKTHRWEFVSAHAEVFGVQRICRVLQVSRSGYYRWLAGAKARRERQAADNALFVEIREIHTGRKGAYGVRRTHGQSQTRGAPDAHQPARGAATCGVASAPRSRTRSRHPPQTSSNATSVPGS